MSKPTERILCAAIHFDDGKTKYEFQPPNIDTGFVIAGWRHGNCFALVGGLFSELRMAKSRVKRGIDETLAEAPDVRCPQAVDITRERAAPPQTPQDFQDDRGLPDPARAGSVLDILAVSVVPAA